MWRKFLKYYKQIIIIILLLLIIPLYKPIKMWHNFHSAVITSYDSKDIDTNAEPVQELYKHEISQSKIFEYKSLKKNITAKITPVAYYKVGGQVVAHNTYFPLKNGFDYIALYDIGLVWGKLAENDFFKTYCSAKSEEVIVDGMFPNEGNARMLMPQCILNDDQIREKIGYTWMEYESKISHTHLIPANNNIMSALNTIKKYDIVELEGDIVNVKVQKEYGEHISSLERDDDDESAIGGGACEIMYVTKVKIGHNVYQ